jgi:hypothetical protein
MSVKPAALLLALFGYFGGQFGASSISGPATTPNPDFPLHVHIFIAKAGFGRGDLLGPAPEGFDYTTTCENAFFNNGQAAEFYQARWKKPNAKIEILLQRIGGDHTSRCELNIDLKGKPYGRYTASATPQPATPAPSTPAQPAVTPP